MSDEPPQEIPTIDASSPKQKLEGKAIPTPIAQPAELEEHKLLKMPIFARPWIEKGRAFWKNRWTQLVCRAVSRLGLIASAVVTLLWTLALWDSYRPKITVSPGGTLNSKSPFGTYFIVQNQGALSISNIRYLTRLEAAPMPGETNAPKIIGQEQNVTVIPQMGSLESYSLTIQYRGIQINPIPAINQNTSTNQPPIAATNQVAGSTGIPVVALLLTFEISYDPKWYWKRVEIFHFTGLNDVNGNWQWLPSAHQRITDQIIDTNLIQRVQPSPPPNNAVPTPNGGPVNSPPSVKIGNGAQVHTN